MKFHAIVTVQRAGKLDGDGRSDADITVTIDKWHTKQWVMVHLRGQISQLLRNSTEKRYVKSWAWAQHFSIS